MNASKSVFHSGDKVFAKMKGYPHWPARIISLSEKTKNRYQVHFYGTNQTAVVKGDSICSYLENKSTLGKPKKHRGFNDALLEIEAAVISDMKKEKLHLFHDSESDDNMTTTVSGSGENEGVILSNNLPDKKKKPQKIKTNKTDLKRKLSSSAPEDNLIKRKDVKKSTENNRRYHSVQPSNYTQVFVNQEGPSTSGIIKTELNSEIIIKDESGNYSEDSAKENSEHYEDCIYAVDVHGKNVIIPLNMNVPTFTNQETLIRWKKKVLAFGKSLKVRIEAGEDVGNVFSLMNEWTLLKSCDYIHCNVEKKKGKRLKFLRIEANLLDIDIEIKKSLSLYTDAKPYKCLGLLDQLNALKLTQLMLKKQPDVVWTIRRMRNYIGNVDCWNLNNEELKAFKITASQIRKKSVALYNKFKILFENRTVGHFWNYFTKEVEIFRTKTKHLTLAELLSLTEEPA